MENNKENKNSCEGCQKKSFKNKLNEAFGKSSEEKLWWREGLRIFSEISAWIVGPMVVALMVGKKLDAYYQTEPKLFLGMAIVGFLITTYGIILSVRKFSRKIKSDEKELKNLEKNKNI